MPGGAPKPNFARGTKRARADPKLIECRRIALLHTLIAYDSKNESTTKSKNFS